MGKGRRIKNPSVRYRQSQTALCCLSVQGKVMKTKRNRDRDRQEHFKDVSESLLTTCKSFFPDDLLGGKAALLMKDNGSDIFMNMMN